MYAASIAKIALQGHRLFLTQQRILKKNKLKNIFNCSTFFRSEEGTGQKH